MKQAVDNFIAANAYNGLTVMDKKIVEKLKSNPDSLKTLYDFLHDPAYKDPALSEDQPTHTHLAPRQAKLEEGQMAPTKRRPEYLDNLPSKLYLHDNLMIYFYACLIGDLARSEEIFNGLDFKARHRSHTLQETIRARDKVRLFVDLDSDDHFFTKPEIDEIKKAFAAEFCNMHSDHNNNMKDDPQIARAIVLRNQKSPKKKIHIHFPNFICTKEVMVMVAQKVKAGLPVLGQYIDTNYSGCRVALCHKGDDLKSVYYDPDHPPSAPSQALYNLGLLLETRVRAFEWEKVWKLKPEYEELFDEKRQLQDLMEQDELDVDTEERRQKMQVWVDKLGAGFTATWQGRDFYLQRQCSSMCYSCQRVHDSENARITIRDGCWITYYCYHKTSKRLEQVAELSDEQKRAQAEWYKKKLKKTLSYELPYYVQETTHDEPRMRPLDINKSVQLVWGPMDTGKTYRVVDFIVELLEKKLIETLIFVSMRRNFAHDVCERLRRGRTDPLTGQVKDVIDIHCYMDGELDGHSNVMISTESLHKIKNPPTNGLVVMDEVTSALAQMNSGLHGSRLSRNQDKMEMIIRESKFLVCMDADIDNRAVNFVHHLRPDDEIYLEHCTFKKRAGWTAIDSKYEINWFDALKESLRKGRNVVIPITSESFGINKVEDFVVNECGIPWRQVRFYHSKGNDYKDELKDVNTSWLNFRVVIYTSVISVGVDFSPMHFNERREWVPYEHFHEMFVYGTVKSNAVREVKQMMGRVRHVAKKRVTYLLDTRGAKYCPTTHDHIRREAESQLGACEEITSKILSDIEKRYRKICGVHRYTIHNNIWSWLSIENRREVNMSQVHYASLFALTLENQGFRLTYDVSVPEKEEEKELAIYFKGVREGNQEALVAKVNTICKELPAHEIAVLEEKKVNSVATANDKLQLNYNKYLENIKPECRSMVNGAVYVSTCDLQGQINRQRMELDLTVRDVVELDTNESLRFGDVKNTLLSKFDCILKINKLLGVTSTADRKTKITQASIEANLEQWRELLTNSLRSFPNRTRNPSEVTDGPSVKARVDTIYKQWSGTKIASEVVDRVMVQGARTRSYKYWLEPQKAGFFDHVVQNLWKPHVKPEIGKKSQTAQLAVALQPKPKLETPLEQILWMSSGQVDYTPVPEQPKVTLVINEKFESPLQYITIPTMTQEAAPQLGCRLKIVGLPSLPAAVQHPRTTPIDPLAGLGIITR